MKGGRASNDILNSVNITIDGSRFPLLGERAQSAYIVVSLCFCRTGTNCSKRKQSVDGNTVRQKSNSNNLHMHPGERDELECKC